MSPLKFKAGSKTFVILAHVGTLIAVSAWGTSFIATKVLMVDGGFSPVEVYTYRFALAYLFLLCVTFTKIFANNWRDELTLAICGICTGSIYFILENYALKYTTTGNVSLLSAISPLMTTMLMGIVYKMRISFGNIVGSIIAFVGVGCIIFSHGESVEINPLGDLLALGAALSWAIYSIIAKRVIPYYSSLFITRKMFFYGVVSSLPLLFMQKEPIHLDLLFSLSNPMYLGALLFLVLMCSIAAYLLWNEAMKVLGSVTTNNYIYMQPFVTMIAGYFMLGEQIFLLGYIGCALIVGGLVLADKWDPKFNFRTIVRR